MYDVWNSTALSVGHQSGLEVLDTNHMVHKLRYVSMVVYLVYFTKYVEPQLLTLIAETMFPLIR